MKGSKIIRLLIQLMHKYDWYYKLYKSQEKNLLILIIQNGPSLY